MKTRILIPALLAALIPTAFIAAPTIAQSMRAGAGGVSAAVCRVVGGESCAMQNPGVTFPGLSSTAGVSVGTCTDTAGPYDCLKLTGGPDRVVGLENLHSLVVEDGLISIYDDDDASLSLMWLISKDYNPTTSRGSFAASLYPNGEGVWIAGTDNTTGTAATSIAMHGDVSGGSTTDFTVHVGAYEARATSGAPLLCASSDIDEISSAVDPQTCLYPDGSIRAGILNGGFIGIDTAVTSLAGTLCDADIEVSRRYKYSKNAAADITECVCQKIGGVYGFAATTATGDCT